MARDKYNGSEDLLDPKGTGRSMYTNRKQRFLPKNVFRRFVLLKIRGRPVKRSRKGKYSYKRKK